MAKRIATHHKGAPRCYFCSEFLDTQGKLVPTNNGCMQAILRDGEPIPKCPGHGLPLQKPRFKRVQDHMLEAYTQQKASIQGMSIWPDVARRKAKCHMCYEIIDPGDKRIAFDAASKRGISAPQGGVIARTRHYVHMTCFLDMLGGGTPGEGCPGCSAKILHDEFMSIRSLLEKRHA